MVEVLKKALPQVEHGADRSLVARVAEIISGVEESGDAAVREYSRRFDDWDPASFRLSEAEVESAIAMVDPRTLEDIHFAQDQIRRFAEVQRSALVDVEVETLPGVSLGHRNLPVASVGAAWAHRSNERLTELFRTTATT